MADIKEYLPSNLSGADDAFTQQLLTAISEGDQEVFELIQAVIDQFFLDTANGLYLVRLGEEQGFIMPPNSGLDVRAFRVLIPLMVSAPKQVRRTIDQMLQAFYGIDRTKPTITSSISQPFSLESGDDLIVETESGTASVGILADQVSDIANITAGELSAVLNTLQDLFTAEVFTNRITGQKFLRIASKAEGSSAFIRVRGGTIQNILQFPTTRNTSQETGTTWNVTKDETYTDVTTFKWDGSGTNPNVYLVKPGDVVSIRGLQDGAQPLSLLNGSYEILEAGYDYFIIRNSSFQSVAASVTQPTDTTLMFTSAEKLNIYDRPEFALSAETKFNTGTVTIPALPPLARRFLSGSAHLHGYAVDVLDFTRTSMQVDLPEGVNVPASDNAFAIKTKHMRYDYQRKYYRTFGVDSNQDTPTFNVQGSGDNSVFPHTTPALLGDNPIYSEPGSEDFILTSTPAHGLRRGWGFTIENATGSANISASQLNAEHVVFKEFNNHKIRFRLKDSNGDIIKFEGVNFGPFDVHRHPSPQSDDSDFYLEFATSGDVTASGLKVGSIVRLHPTDGTNTEPFYGNALRFRKLFVTSINGNQVNIKAGLGTGPEGQVISNANGFRDDHFGGTSITYKFDKTSPHNQNEVMSSLKANLMAYTQSTNEAYVGSFLYDQEGLEYPYTVSGFIANTKNVILRGSNETIVELDKVEDVLDGKDYPQSGEVLIGYGTKDVEGPIRFNAVIASDTGPDQIILDPGYRFEKTHPAGTKIQMLRADEPFRPGQDGSNFPVYLTGTAQARNTLVTLLESLVALGIFLEADVILPDLKYEDSAIEPFE